MRIHLPHLLRTAAIILGAFLLASCARSISLDNLALLHPAYHSSAIDYNATAQLAVDGIIETQPARWVEICGNDGKPLSKIEHDIPLDPRPWTTVTVEGSQAELSLRTHGFLEPVNSSDLCIHGGSKCLRSDPFCIFCFYQFDLYGRRYLYDTVFRCQRFRGHETGIQI